MVSPESELEILRYVLTKVFSWTFGSAGEFGSPKVKIADSSLDDRGLKLDSNEIWLKPTQLF